ncbi:MAG: iron-regulated protein [Candidatus Tectomicrobia bacterium]|nr:iron-regulated protein [Candidatus Tectomicrobia bacterium]
MQTRPLALGISLLALSWCLPAGAPQSATVEKVVAHYADLVHAGYADSHKRAVELQSALQTLTERPSAAALEAAKNAWKRARIPYGQTEAFRFYGGPIDDADGPEGLINAWPMDEGYVDYVMGNPCTGIVNNLDAPITREHLVALNEQGGEENVSTGYHAIEFLLWGQDLSADGPGARPVSDYEGAPRRAQYLHTVAAQLVDDLQYLVDEWAPGQNGNYRTAFLAQAPREALRQILVGVGTLSRSELAGERMAVALESQDQEDEHSCFSDNTHDDIIRNAQGIQNVIQGRYVRGNGVLVEGPGILSLLQDERRAELEGKTRNAMAAAHTIKPPFDNEITSPLGRQRVLAAIHALRAQAESIVNAAADLGIANLQVALPE